MPPFHPAYHYAFDLLAYGASIVLFRAQLKSPRSLNPALARSGYWIAVAIGAVAGAYVFGSLNLSGGGELLLGHSVAGAIAGGTFGAELFKWRNGLVGSTGAPFVIPLAVGVGLGRFGCFFAGSADQTFGVESAVPWAVDFGDGRLRHPVQLYEALSLLAFAGAAIVFRRRRPQDFGRAGFYAFVFFYSAQRFAWEFLKPYPRVWRSFNLFHLLCGALILYSLYMTTRAYADPDQPA